MPADDVRDDRRLAGDLAVREAQHEVTAHGQPGVAFTVRLERPPGPVGPVAVHLDYQAALRPQEVDV